MSKLPKLDPPSLRNLVLAGIAGGQRKKLFQYLGDHPGALKDLGGRGIYLTQAVGSNAPYTLYKLLLTNGVRWEDELDYPLTLPTIFKEGTAAQWLELCKLGSGAAPSGFIIAGGHVHNVAAIQMWQGIALKALVENDEAALAETFAWARARGIVTEATSRYPPYSLLGIDYVSELHGLSRERWESAKCRLLMKHGVDAQIGGVSQSKKKAPIHASESAEQFRDGIGTEPLTDFRIAVSGGELPRMVKEMIGGERERALLEACDTLSPYYRKKYHHTLTSLPRIAAVEKSALAGWARGGVA